MERKLNSIWKKQLLCCVAVFFAGLLAGYLLHNGVPVILGGAVLCVSAVAAERGLRCPSCGESVFKQAMERTSEDGFACPKCKKRMEWR